MIILTNNSDYNYELIIGSGNYLIIDNCGWESTKVDEIRVWFYF